MVDGGRSGVAHLDYDGVAGRQLAQVPPVRRNPRPLAPAAAGRGVGRRRVAAPGRGEGRAAAHVESGIWMRMVALSERMSGRNDSVCGQIGVRRTAGKEGWTWSVGGGGQGPVRWWQRGRGTGRQAPHHGATR